MLRKTFMLGMIAILLVLTGCGGKTNPASTSNSAPNETQTTNQSDGATATQNQPDGQTDKNNQSNQESANPSSDKPVKQLALDFDKIYQDEDIREYARAMIGQKAPNFTLTNLNGEKVKLSDFKGKNVILELAKTTCPFCQKVHPVIDEFRKSHEDVVVLQVFASEDKNIVETYFKTNQHDIHEGVLTGEGPNNVFRDYRTKWVPNFIFIDKNGFISFIHVGELDQEMLQDMVKLAF